ncbi:MAG TPA: hypothetical protein DDW94_12520 [Deltaproteobacteria bacterium]|nr:MAG: hypothetical protein A2Z79_08665 [Deltaproteobacteria bacterium GWA2_55_82]OGQ64526.1 MAG: hypothetical protein A3I81_07655 [Deltaproteobacteria bacterium RIFCSPLOWO2_02_FULL_55_12]OIJ73652.1 MAG: hypothetical protein A2V21_304860 [Deltaproteobacteria bacterium GWC2_55_46]HBG47794.1 hypothetical protein [Deltaproteobacteria bacterium]HCY11984.1 hypothetical protein [Deltaproteobacteria bacterium]
MRKFRSETASPYNIPRPPFRRLRIYSIDPSLAHSLETIEIREARIELPWESSPDDEKHDGPAPGPRGEYLDIIDYDPSTDAFYKPVDLNDPYLLAQDGLAPSDGNPQFHQQMVYAVAMRTIRNFEVALGRRALWAPRRWVDESGAYREEYVSQLRIYPHALREANAYYSPEKKALLFGYFQAAPTDVTDHLPGGVVFTCLSHDVVAHETAHALLDGMHRRLTEPSNPDVLAFHEAFADVVALFQHFSLPDVVRHQISKTRGDLKADNLLAKLAREFGRAIGRTDALRSAIGKTPDPAMIDRVTEPHERGAILVAAVFDAFLAIYNRRTADLFRLATHGSGMLPEGAIHPDLVSRLSTEAAKAAQHVLTICIRALDYLPPVDVTFGDYLRALITADFDLVPNDSLGYRVAFMEAFRRRGIYPRDVRTLSEESLIWEGSNLTSNIENPQIILGSDVKLQMQNWNLSGLRQDIYHKLKEAREEAHTIIERTRHYKERLIKGLDFERKFEVHSIRPVRRSGPDGQLLLDMVVEITQRTPGFLDLPLGQCQKDLQSNQGPDFWFRGGCTLIVDLETGKLRYCIYKDINSERRYDRQRAFVDGMSAAPSLSETYFGITGYRERDEVFAFVHRIRGEENKCD